MKYLLITLIAGSLALLPTMAFAQCQTVTIIGSDGQAKLCQQCCYGGMCQLHCL